jgi:4'-phosphopantetheinyl transferase
MAMLDAYVRPDGHPQLDADAVHVWRVRINPAPRALATMAQSLSADERNRADRFHFEPDLQRYIAARATLRRLLGEYAAVTPAELAFRYGARGKPDVEAPAEARAIQFNVSHRSDFALMAFTRGREVGIDIEYLREVPEALTIARNHFTAAETRLLENALAGTTGRDCFFRLWTRKEAVIKAVGTGLSMPLAEFDVSSTAERGDAWHVVQVPSRPVVTWAVRDLRPAEEYRGALCVAGTSADASFWCADDD